MLIDQLSPRYGSTKSVLTADERNLALKIGGVGLQPDAEHTIIDVQVQLKNIKLQVKHIETEKKGQQDPDAFFCVCQVMRIKYKGVNPERPMSNLFSSHWTIITPLQKVSLQQINMDWEKLKRPKSGYIFFLRYNPVV